MEKLDYTKEFSTIYQKLFDINEEISSLKLRLKELEITREDVYGAADYVYLNGMIALDPPDKALCFEYENELIRVGLDTDGKVQICPITILK